MVGMVNVAGISDVIIFVGVTAVDDGSSIVGLVIFVGVAGMSAVIGIIIGSLVWLCGWYCWYDWYG